MAVVFAPRPINTADGDPRLERGIRWHPIVASNRGPIEHTLNCDGVPVPRAASGGVVTALSQLARHIDFSWIATAASEGDRRVAAQGSVDQAANPKLRFVALPPEVYHHHYHSFSNPLLWFLQHSLWHRLSQGAIENALGAGWLAGYLPANAAFAVAIASEARRLGQRPVIMLQDYHLYLVASYLRQMLPEALLQHFVHIPWPEPRQWLGLPPGIRLAIFRGLLANDVVGFQTQADARRFLLGCSVFLEEAVVDDDEGSITHAQGRTLARAYPISIDLEELQGTLASPEVDQHFRLLSSFCGERTIVRVDRLDPSKDVANGFRAFDRLLQAHPEWIGRVKFLAFLVPTRTSIPEYAAYADETFAEVAAINARHARPGYEPIKVFYENNRAQALAGLKQYDVLLVNPVADGMNLVAKEGPVANERSGVLVLSDGAGAHQQLGRAAMSVARGDIDGMAESLDRALKMPLPERRARAMQLRGLVAEAHLGCWLRSQLDDLALLRTSPHNPDMRNAFPLHRVSDSDHSRQRRTVGYWEKS